MRGRHSMSLFKFMRNPEAKKRRLEERLQSLLQEAGKLTREIVNETEPAILPERDRFEFEEVPPPNEHLPLNNSHHAPIVYAKRFALEFGELEERFRERILRSIRHYAEHNDHNPKLQKKTAGIKPANCYYIKVGLGFMVIYQILDGKVKFLSIVKY